MKKMKMILFYVMLIISCSKQLLSETEHLIIYKVDESIKSINLSEIKLIDFYKTPNSETMFIFKNNGEERELLLSKIKRIEFYPEEPEESITIFKNNGTSTTYMLANISKMDYFFELDTPMLLKPNDISIDVLPVVSATWKNVLHSSSYNVMLSKNIDFSNIIINENIQQANYVFQNLELGESFYWKVRAENEFTVSNWSDTRKFTVIDIFDNDLFFVSLAQGWNFISSYIETEDMSMEAVFEDIEDDIVIVKMGSGIYIPANDLNTLGDWNITKAYNVFASSATTLVMQGTAVIPEDTDITLTTGWNAVPYLRQESMAITTALADIESKLVIVKNRSGQIWIPGSINTIQTMYPGEGYSIFMTEGAVLNYPEN